MLYIHVRTYVLSMYVDHDVGSQVSFLCIILFLSSKCLPSQWYVHTYVVMSITRHLHTQGTFCNGKLNEIICNPSLWENMLHVHICRGNLAHSVLQRSRHKNVNDLYVYSINDLKIDNRIWSCACFKQLCFPRACCNPHSNADVLGTNKFSYQLSCC